MTTPLAERMAKHVLGQVTWPEPLLGRVCKDCAHFAAGGFKSDPDKGRCRLVAAHQNVTGEGFAGSTAIACPKFKGAAE